MLPFKVNVAPVTENSITAYAAGEASSIQFAGSMTRTPKESQQEFYYDDDLYTQVKDVAGDEVEVRFAEIPLATLAQLGLGTYSEETGTLEADFNVTGRTYAFRCVTNTVDGLPMYFNWRVFDLTGIRFDNFASKGSNLSVCEVIMSGVFNLLDKTGGVKTFIQSIMRRLRDRGAPRWLHRVV